MGQVKQLHRVIAVEKLILMATDDRQKPMTVPITVALGWLNYAKNSPAIQATYPLQMACNSDFVGKHSESAM